MIEVQALTKRYGAHTAVEDLSFTAPAGAVTGVIGPNGAGKTTTFRCLLGLVDPTGGRALIGGQPYRALEAPRTCVGAVLETTGFHPARTGRSHLRVLARAAGIDPARVDDVLDVVALRADGGRRVGGYSLGMRQRLGIAAAMLGDPAVIVLDEPVNGLDPEGVVWMRRLLRTWAGQGRTVVVSSHLLAELAQVVDRVVVIRGGRLVAETDIGSLNHVVVVRVDRPDVMVAALRASGAGHELRADGAIAVRGREPSEVGRVAAQAGVAVIELARATPGEALEAMFFAVTGDRGDG
ncbi:MAG: ABC transporter ATP-binding protein [Actinobacteria bacterium]|nr:ABC transporter ATP-binding protein [Actinomycetota bacterium]